MSYTGEKTILDFAGVVDLTAAEAIEKGDLVTADGYKADANDTKYAKYVALVNAASAAVFQAAEIAVLAGVSGNTAAAALYASDTDGDPSETPSTTNYQLVGRNIGTTDYILAPGLLDSRNWMVVTATANFPMVNWTLTDAEASGGAYDAGFKITVANNAAKTGGRICAASLNCEPKDAVDAYKVVGGEVCTYMASSVTVTGAVHGFFCEMQGATSIGSDCYSLYVYYAPSCVPSGSSAAVRIENNTSADGRMDSGFIAFVGGKGDFFITCGPLATQTAWAYTGTVSTQSGWLKIKVGSATRYIGLYTSVS